MLLKLRIVGIGNSIVNGFPLKRSECFLSQIRAITGHEVINKGVNGETTEDIVKRFNRDLLFHCPDIGIIMTGTNDFIYKKATPQKAMENIGWMVRKMEENQIEPILLTPILVNAKMAQECWMVEANINYEEVNQKLCELGKFMLGSYPQYTVELGRLFEEEMKEMKREEVYIDGLHPTTLSHKKIGEIIIQEKIN